MNISALFNLSYGMYIVSAKDGLRDVGCIANSIIQVSSDPATLAISLNKNNYTHSCIQRSNWFAVSVLTENISRNVIAVFGFSSGRSRDKFSDIDHITSPSGFAIPNDGVCAYIEGRVISQADCATHTIFIAEILNAENLSDEHPMTYEYYHKVIKGKTSKNAPTYIGAT